MIKMFNVMVSWDVADEEVCVTPLISKHAGTMCGKTLREALASLVTSLELYLEVGLQDGDLPAHWPAKFMRCPLCGAPNDGVCPGCKAVEGAWG